MAEKSLSSNADVKVTSSSEAAEARFRLCSGAGRNGSSR